jgi:hypothetical protein
MNKVHPRIRNETSSVQARNLSPFCLQCGDILVCLDEIMRQKSTTPTAQIAIDLLHFIVGVLPQKDRGHFLLLFPAQ